MNPKIGYTPGPVPKPHFFLSILSIVCQSPKVSTLVYKDAKKLRFAGQLASSVVCIGNHEGYPGGDVKAAARKEVA